MAIRTEGRGRRGDGGTRLVQAGHGARAERFYAGLWVDRDVLSFLVSLKTVLQQD